MPQEMSRQEFDALAARVAQSAPPGLSREEFNDLIVAEAMKASGYEAPLTRERRAPGAPSAQEAGHHPETGGREMFGTRIPSLREIGADDVPSDAAFLKRAPQVGGAAGMVLGGPLGAGVGAAGGSLLKGQMDRGAHMPTGSELSHAAGEGGTALVLGGAPRALAAGARTIGPAMASHAKGISKGISALSGIGGGIVSGNPLTGIGMGAATKMLTSPSGIRAVGNFAGRAGAAVPSHAANKAGFGAISAEALREALLDALGAESSASTVP